MRDDEEPEGEPADEDEGAEPESPYPTEELDYMVADEVLTVRLRGISIGASTIALKIAGPFMFRLQQIVHATATAMSGRPGGARGQLPDVEEAGLLAFAGLTSGNSVDFHFTIAEGEVFRLDEDASITERALEVVTGFVESIAAQDEEALYETTRILGKRVGANLVLLAKVLDSNNLESVWRTRFTDRPVKLVPAAVERSVFLLEREDLPNVRDAVIRGWLYETNAKERKFQFAPLDPLFGEEIEKLDGTYPPEARSMLRDAWDHEVTLKVLVREKRLVRQEEPTEVTLEFLDLIDTHD